MDSLIGRLFATLALLLVFAFVGHLIYAAYEADRVLTFAGNLERTVRSLDSLEQGSLTTAGTGYLLNYNVPASRPLWATVPPKAGAPLWHQGALVDPWGDILLIVGAGDPGAWSGLAPYEYEVTIDTPTMSPGDCMALVGALAPGLSRVVFGGTTKVYTVNASPSAQQIQAGCTQIERQAIWLFFRR